MTTHHASARFWWSALGIAVLAVGLFMAYLVKTQPLGSPAQYRLIGGQAYASADDDAKQDIDAKQKYGGNFALIVAAYKHKLHELLQGENLAYVLAIVTVVLAAGCFRMAWFPD